MSMPSNRIPERHHLLFLLYINDQPNSPGLLNFILFVDDINVSLSHKSLEFVDLELVHVADWFKSNRLSLSKTCYVVFVLIESHFHIKI